MSRIRIVGLGNAWRGDDAVGLLAAERLQQLADAGIEVLRLETPDWQMFEGLRSEDHLIVIDGCLNDSLPGTVRRLDISELSTCSLRHCSSHGLGLAHWLSMAEALGEETGRLLIYAVSIGQTEMGAPLSPEVGQAIEQLLPMLQQQIDKLCKPASHA